MKRKNGGKISEKQRDLIMYFCELFFVKNKYFPPEKKKNKINPNKI